MPLFGEEHVKRYRETGGEEGHDWQGTTALLLTTTGRKSGQTHTTPLIYQPNGTTTSWSRPRAGPTSRPPGT